MQIHLRKKKLKDGRESLYLDIYREGKRSYEFLKLYIKKGNPNNKELLLLAEKIKSKRLIELANSEYEQISNQKKKASFIKYFEKSISHHKRGSNYYSALKHLKNYTNNELNFKQINKNWLIKFSEYLEKDLGLKPNTSFLYFRRTKEALYKASSEGFINLEVVRSVRSLPRGKVKREFLELFELEKLINTPLEKPEVKRAFIFSCFTGLRQSDIRNLKWENIVNNTIQIEQQKTKDKVKIPISKTALNVLRQDNIFHLPNMNVFHLPKDRGSTNKYLKKWFNSAGVDKNAYYHLSRHTFATLNLTSGNEIYTVSKLLGHKSLKTTEIYANIIDEKKKQAVDNLPEIEVNL